MFPDCVLPGCRNPVTDPREPCTDCLRAFGPMLRTGGSPYSTADIADRDAYVRAAYTAQRVSTP